MYELWILNEGVVYVPAVLDGVEIEWTRAGVPGKMTFSIVEDAKMKVANGDEVDLTVNGTPLFFGYVFDIRRDKAGVTSITAYDPLRYLKNKDTYTYENKTAAEVAAMVAADFLLQVGDLDDTEHVIPSRVEDGKTLFDIIQNAIDLTNISAGRLYVLYADYDKIALKNVDQMLVPILIDGETGEDFEYTTTIDGETYNQVKLIYEDKEEKKRQVFVTRDEATIEKWGLLQYYEKVDSVDNWQTIADTRMEQYNREERNLTISGVHGDIRVRAGSSVMVKLDLGDITIGSVMVVEHVRHVFNADDHRMDLELRGDLIGS